jgi:Sulfatase-modifying factor enzyme 1
MKHGIITLLVAGICLWMAFSMQKPLSDSVYVIPTQSLNLFQLIGDTVSDQQHEVRLFEISKQVTFREYKEYLKAIRKDSSDQYYRSQLPDSTIAKRADWEKYISDKMYDEYPVLGISWDNAMNYCKWKTLKENKKALRFIYRLPHSSEWLAAKHYLETNDLESDFSKNYSDWLLGTKDESLLFERNGTFSKWPYNYMYLHKQDDPMAMKRKLVIGDSYRYQPERQIDCFFSYYSTQGYRQIGFRLVKEMVIWEDDEIINDNNTLKILDSWNLLTD